MSHPRQFVHATAVAIDGRVALIIGPPGSGKSDLALRLIMMPLHDGGRPLKTSLVADDQVIVERRGSGLIALCPASTAGLIEVRGLGIMSVPNVDGIAVALIASVDPAQAPERLPSQPEHMRLLGLDLPLVRLDGRHASAPAKLTLALLRLTASGTNPMERCM